MEKFNKIFELYDTMSEDEKIKLFLKFQSLDMREHYDPRDKKYQVLVKNYYGQIIIDKMLWAYNERTLRKELFSILALKNIQPWDEMRDSYMEGREKSVFRNNSWKEYETIVQNPKTILI